MQSVPYKDYQVFLYESMFHTRSPLLKEIYCESHRYEPWAVHGKNQKCGRYLFRNILYIENDVRNSLLNDIHKELHENSEYVEKLLKRFKKSSKNLQKHLFYAKKGDYSRKNIKAMIEETAKMLSSGIFKEIFEYREAMNFLSNYMPADSLRNSLLLLYQPLCIPHYLKYELKLLFFTEKYAEDRNEKWILRCISQCAYLTRFLIEDTPFDNPSSMKKEMEKIIKNCGNDINAIKEKRDNLRENHMRAIKDALKAEHDILEAMNNYGSYSLRTKIIVKNCIKFIQFIATLEELKHIFAVQTAKALKDVLKKYRLRIEKADIKDLLKKL